MTMLTSLYTAVSGLGSNGTALSVIGDNIANVNTTAYKGSRANFGDVLSQSLGGGSNLQVGRGSLVSSVQQMFSQGTLETTGNPLDMAIDGDGFFMIREPAGAQFYTRAGQFAVDKNGYIVNPNGDFLLGYQADAAGNITANLDRINIATVNSAPNQSSSINVQFNLDSREVAPITPWNLSATTGPATGSYNFASSITVYDSLGNSHLVNMYYRKTGADTWDVHAIYNMSANGVN
ncbi:MAG TPA: flagellar hook-basal body complex protein, partial [Dissulfurispiraceae bacterium]|nr:flagellar hook-basal body complex protein [Dissulfurispiraceae bacterium]